MIYEKFATKPLIDNASYHKVQLEKCPNMSWCKEDIIEWLRRRNTVLCNDTLKAELYNFEVLDKPGYKTYVCLIPETTMC